MGRRILLASCCVALAAALAGLSSWVIIRHRSPTIAIGAPHPNAAPTTRPAASTTGPAPATPPVGYLDCVRLALPDLPTTQPLKIPLDLSAAAHWISRDPVYLSGPPRMDLWITHDGAAPTDRVLKTALDPDANVEAHVLGERVAFVHWMPTESGPWIPYLVCHGKVGRDELVAPGQREDMPDARDYRWELAFSWDKRFVVPTSTGVSVFSVSPLRESHVNLADETSRQPSASAPATRSAEAPTPGPRGAMPQALIEADNQSLLAWIPASAGHRGSLGVARFVDGKWSRLGPAEGWAAQVIYLVPLLDGSVLQIAPAETHAAALSLMSLGGGLVDEKRVAELVEALSDPEQEKRNQAFDQLNLYGPGAWSVLEKLLNDQPPEAQERLRQLLHNRVQPTLGGMSLLGERRMQVAARLSDGGVVLYAEQGVSIADSEGQSASRAPAWISIRPGHVIELLPAALTTDLRCGQSRLFAVGDEWIASFDASGPQHFIGNGFVPLLRPDETRFSDVVGVDHRGRWLFRSGSGQETLVIDPTVPDPTPRLPAWRLPAAVLAGWDKDDWPVVKHDSAYALEEHGWQLLDEKETIFTTPNAPAPQPLPKTSPASQPTTDRTASTPAATRPAEPPLLIDRQGNRYFGGRTELRVIDSDGHERIWPLPPIASGKGDVWLIESADGRLFLFNQPGRVLRLRPSRERESPLEIEATFSQNIPNVDHPTRIWLDPAGRIDIVWNNQITVLFPTGYIPSELREKMQGNQ